LGRKNPPALFVFVVSASLFMLAAVHGAWAAADEQKAVAASAPLWDVLYGQARAHYQASRIPEANAALREILRLHPGDEQARTLLESIEQETFRPEAGQLFNQTVSELYDTGLRAYRQGDLQAAIASWQQAANVMPDHPQIQERLAKAQEAVKVRQEKKSIQQLMTTLENAVTKQAWEEALGALMHLRAMPLDPEETSRLAVFEDTCAPFLRARIKHLRQVAERAKRLGKRQEEQRAYSDILAIAPDDAAALLNLAILQKVQSLAQEQEQRQAKARQLLQLSRAAFAADDQSTALELARQAQGAAATREGAEWLEMLEASQRQSKQEQAAAAEALYQDGLRFYQQGEITEAKRLWHRVLALDPSHAKTLKTLGALEKP
jgi:outer membrane protein assembly factor BamD (BamD/ComL family)